MLTPSVPNDVLDNLPTDRLAIGFSGGGDSTALIHMCRNLPVKPLILIVDHALRSGSALEAQQAQNFAQNLGLEALILTWLHEGVRSAIQERARKARYKLMGQACRDAGISYLLTAHTNDDQAETLLMRYEMGTGWRGAAGIAKSSYGPLWPELAGVTLIRPLLDYSRDDLRGYNCAHDLTWIEDPSNKDESFTRIRARKYLSQRTELKQHFLDSAKEMQTGLRRERSHLKKIADRNVKTDELGLIRVSGSLPSRLWVMVLRAGSGTGGPIVPEKISKLKKAAARKDFAGLTLAGAYVTPEGSSLSVGPDPSVYKGRDNRGAIGSVELSVGSSIIWDGRFNIKSDVTGATVMTVHEAMRRYPDVRREIDRAKTNGMFYQAPDVFRGSIPVIVKNGELISNLGAIPPRGACIRSLVAQRLQEMLEPSYN